MKNSSRRRTGFSRRQFIQTSAAGGRRIAFAVVGPKFDCGSNHAGPRTAVDQVTLGKTGIKLSRLGFGTGSNNGHEQAALGKDGFIKLIHYAYDQGITYIDCAQAYATFDVDRRRHQGIAARKTVHPVQGARQAGGRAGGD